MDTRFADMPPRGAESGRVHRPALSRVFLGRLGIRAGWRLVLFLAFAAFFAAVLASAVHRVGIRVQAKSLTAEGALLSEGSVLVALLLSAVIMSRIEGLSFSEYALPGRATCGFQFGQGVIWGFAALTALLLLMKAGQGFSLDGVALHGVELLRYAASWAAAFLAVALLEEFLFRGYALFTLSTGMGFWPAAVLLSAAFGAVHIRNGGETWIGALAAGLIGLFFCFTVRRTGSLWFAIGLHFMWDYSESFIYSVPDSGILVTGHLFKSSVHGPPWLTGGAVGPEASLLVFPVIGLLFVLFARIYRDVRFPAPASGRVASQPLPNPSA